MKYLAPLIMTALLAGCAIHDPADVAGKLSREFDKGERLMIACQKNESRCPRYEAFKQEWEREVDYLTTFEAALANHKARIARGYSV
ncbi:hypothetical protein [Roseobacter ponti]|uniref:Lipoprotein n=1 Tax=Roseobacter ponti TaxID=1891787 RepID=A0A858SV25_9RHOB|nr:hypothetical protein [Roseobacter ponti]QJF51857.1 hypothetical protein G3256_12125 [Roseobacter ponti]